MRAAKPTGRNAAVMKYDILTALGAHGCGADKHMQRLVLRFITLIVARYNWTGDELSVGQREIAALWSVDERTVKREMARLRDLGWLVTKRAAARGRVAVHGIDLPAIMASTRTGWDRIGQDFAARMAGPEAAPAPIGNVISFPGTPRPEGQGLWPRVQAALHAENPALYAAWFAVLDPVTGPEGLLRLRAPTRFHAAFVMTHHQDWLTALAQAADPAVTAVEVVV